MASTEGRWTRFLRLQVAPFLLFVLVVFAFCGLLDWVASHLPLGHGQYAVNLANQRNEVVVARTNDGLGMELAPCETRQSLLPYVRGQRWELTVYDKAGNVVYREDRTLPAAEDGGALIFTVAIPPQNGSPCPSTSLPSS